MKSRLPDSRRLEQAFQDLEDGIISADDHWWLMLQLREDPEARRAYREHMAFATLLHWSAEASIPEDGQDESSVVTFPKHSREPRPRRLIYVAAAAMVALLAVAGSLLMLQTKEQPPAQVTAGAKTLWEYTNGGIGPDGEFRPGTRLVVNRGSLEIVTRKRTRIVVEGPAILEISDPQRVSVSQGKAWFETSEQDTDFMVMTERLRASCSATRFGVAVSTGSDRIQVEAGEVRLESKLPGISPTTLRTGEAAIADLVGRSRLAPADPGLFVEELQREPAYIHWSFDEESAGAFPATARGMTPAPLQVRGLDGQAVTPRLTEGAFGSGLDLTDGNAFAESAFAGISGGGPRTIAVWVKGAPIPRRYTTSNVYYTPSVVMWGDESIEGGSWTLRAHCISGIIGTQWGANGFLTAGRIGSRRVLDGKWHHIACVFTGEVSEGGEVKVNHYIDGERVPTTWATMGTDVDTRVGSGPQTRLRVAYDSMMPGGPGNVPVMVDELFIMRSALSDEQVRILYQENRFVAAD
ncbi:FecR domain-containing protein [Luteolibacter arcticus]|uniref:FecR domain-containing protein n=1 Tax=Luteolibacter arcticus TaxID=1581411 RepID=A0ABT3GEB5_9BACT|nr:LamG-like jellyroll fold domain-containing protein [Luteolibacter arcticus]MCW1921786.1 FecR domain-containing protein [Luteolibacter arcticus]